MLQSSSFMAIVICPLNKSEYVKTTCQRMMMYLCKYGLIYSLHSLRGVSGIHLRVVYNLIQRIRHQDSWDLFLILTTLFLGK